MKKLASLFFTLAVLSTAWAQETQTRSVGAFSGVKVAEGIDVYLKKGDEESVRVEAGNTKAANVVTEVSGSYLKIYMRDGRFIRNPDVKVYVTYVSVDRLSASSAGNIYSDGVIKSSSMELNASSAATIEVELDVTDDISASASSAAEIELKGKSKRLRAEASSAGQIDADDLLAKSVEADASSAGSIKVSVENELVAHASSGGSIRFRGNPSKSITDASSGGSVKKSS